MKAIFNVENPNDVEFTLTITMRLGDWKRLKEQLGRDYPAWRLGRAIVDMVQQAGAHFYQKTDTSD
jgi:hypothetical protein